jgi:uncharacterized protein
MAHAKILLTSLLGGAALILGGAAAMTVMPDGFIQTAQAQDAAASAVDTAKAAGRIGEQADGYLGAVVSLSPAEQAAMDEINIKRKTVYTKLARDKGVSIEDVAALTAEKLVEKAPRGHMIRDGFGNWIKK